MLLRWAAYQVTNRVARRRPLSYYHYGTQVGARGGGGGGDEAAEGEQKAAMDRSVVGVFWDFENCPVPSSLDPFLFRCNIERTLRLGGFLGPISFRGYGNIHLISMHVLEALSETGIDLHHVPHGGKNSSDRALLIDMLLWTMKHSPPAHVLLISADSDFSILLHKVCLLGYNALLAYPKCMRGPAYSALSSAANIVWDWPDIVMGLGHEQTLDTTMSDEESKNKRCKLNQCHPEDDGGDAIMNSKYGNGNVVKDGGDLPSAVVDRIIGIVKSNPGITLGELTKELRSVNINPLSSGFRSFYQILKTIEQLEIRFVDGERARDRVRLYVTGGKLAVAPTADEMAGDGNVPVLGTSSTWVSWLYDSVRAMQRSMYNPKTWFTKSN